MTKSHEKAPYFQGMGVVVWIPTFDAESKFTWNPNNSFFVCQGVDYNTDNRMWNNLHEILEKFTNFIGMKSQLGSNWQQNETMIDLHMKT